MVFFHASSCQKKHGRYHEAFTLPVVDEEESLVEDVDYIDEGKPASPKQVLPRPAVAVEPAEPPRITSFLPELAHGTPRNQRERYELEKNYLQGHINCRVDIVEDLITNFEKLSQSRVLDLFLDTSTRPFRQEAIGCLIAALNTQPNALREYIEDLKSIAQGGYGEVFLAEKANNPLFIVKRSNQNALREDGLKGRPNETMIHEAFVGMNGINRVRELTPGFIYTYGLVECTSPQYKDVEGLYEWCPPGAPRESFIFLENVQGGVTLARFLTVDEVPVSDLVQILIQVESALQFAYEECKFTHNDLHTGNILVIALAGEVSIPIRYQGVTRFMLSKYVVRIIDYGSSYMETPEGGHIGIQQDGVIPVTSHPWPYRDSNILLYSSCYVLGVRYPRTPVVAEALGFLIRVYQRSGRSLRDDLLTHRLAPEDLVGFPVTDIFFNGYLLDRGQLRDITHDMVMAWIFEEAGIAPESILYTKEQMDAMAFYQTISESKTSWDDVREKLLLP